MNMASEGGDANFDLSLGLSYDESIFITQEPSQNNGNMQNGDSVDLEDVMNSSKDSAFYGDSSFERIMNSQHVLAPPPVISMETQQSYVPQVEEISDDEG